MVICPHCCARGRRTPSVSKKTNGIRPMTQKELATVLERLGCPAEKSLEMASQLDKRATQLAARKDRTYDEALTHLLELMRQGWAAQEQGL
jgi:hypothetical protein